MHAGLNLSNRLVVELFFYEAITFESFQEFDLEGSENCEFDSLNIYNGPDQVNFWICKKFCRWRFLF